MKKVGEGGCVAGVRCGMGKRVMKLPCERWSGALGPEGARKWPRSLKRKENWI